MPSDARLKVILEAKDLSAKAFKSFKGTVAAVTRSVFSLQGGLASVGLALSGMEIFDAGRSMARLEKAFTEITGSAEKMGAEFDFVRDVSDRMGQNFHALIPTYKGLLAASQGTNLEGEKTREIFEAITKASATLGLSSDQTTGALRAIEQIMSKGKLQAEELRLQLGDRLPGAFKLAAEAMGVTTAELNQMLEDGEVLADDFLPRFAQVLSSRYSGAVDSATKASNKFRESWTELKISMAQSGFLESISGAMTNVADTFKDPDFKASMAQFAETLGIIVQKMAEFTKYAGLRSVTNTLGQGLELSQQGLIDFEAFTRAGFLERQKMVDAVLKSPRFAGGYGDNDALEAAFNNPKVKLTPSPIIDEKDAQKSLEAFQRLVDEMTAHTQKNAKDQIEAWNERDREAIKSAEGVTDFWKIQADERLEVQARALAAEGDLWKEHNHHILELREHTIDAMQDSFADFFYNLKDGVADLGELFESFFDSIYRAASQIAAQQITSGIMGAFNFGGPKAGGGPVSPGTTYLVGERGPELLHMGNSPGYVTPNHAIGQPAQVHVHLHKSDQEQTSVTESRGPGGTREVMIAIGNDIAGGGPVGRAITNTYGLMPQPRRV